MGTSVNPLSRLVIDEAAVDLELLARTLEDKIRLDLQRGTFTFLQGVRARMTSRQQLLIALLSQKALHLLKNDIAEGLRPLELEEVTGVKGGTLRPILKSLSDGRMIRPNEQGAYFIPAFSLEDVAAALGSGPV
jgi:hypothetical protein